MQADAKKPKQDNTDVNVCLLSGQSLPHVPRSCSDIVASLDDLMLDRALPTCFPDSGGCCPCRRAAAEDRKYPDAVHSLTSAELRATAIDL